MPSRKILLVTHNIVLRKSVPALLTHPAFIRPSPAVFLSTREYTTNQRKMDPNSIALTEVENTLRQLLLDVVEFIEKNPDSSADDTSQVHVPEELAKAPLRLRWTGGWVRDKLLGKESDDIDVAINKMTGYQFGLRMKEYLDVPQNANKYKVPGSKQALSSKLAKIEANPDKSKHLETATTKILGLEIDLVNLRKETYTEDSRNPQIEFGTPEEDAMRRDATINAMFYNIHTSQVEDFTNHGLTDLEKGIIQTPLEPESTFIDDPLRVLRLIRFASRFGYEIDQTTFESMKASKIKAAFVQKITKERVLTELEKMLKGRDPEMALSLIDDAGLYKTIFTVPDQTIDFTPETKHWREVYSIVGELLKASGESTEDTIKKFTLKDKDEEFQAWFISALVPWADAPTMPAKKVGKTQPSLAAVVMREGLKGPNKLIELMDSSIKHLDDIKKLIHSNESKRDELGMAIRNWGPTWRQQVLFSLLSEILSAPSQKKSLLVQYARFLSTCKRLDILEVYNLKPLMDGKALAKAINIPPGPWMKDALDIVVAYQLRNPDVHDVDQVIKEVKANADVKEPSRKKFKHGELTSALIHYFLHETLRLMFSQKRHPDLTDAGRRNINVHPDSRSSALFDDSPKPWLKQKWSLDLLLWVCKSLTPDVVEKEWGVLIPPLLTLLDEVDIAIKAKGCECLGYVLKETTPSLLQRTGLTPVFEESLFIATALLPTLTPEFESVVIINAAFPALLALANATPEESFKPNHPTRIKLLLKILRQGLLTGMDHAGDHVRVATALADQLPLILDHLGIDSVVHLKDLAPMLSRILDNPLGTAYPSLLLSAAKAEKALIRNTWPRVWFWRGDLLKGPCGVWIRMSEDEKENGANADFEKVRVECRDVVEMLDAVIKVSETKEKWSAEVSTLSEADSSLKDLFKSVQ